MMDTCDPDSTGSQSRREFFQLAALSAATAGMAPDILWAAPQPATNPGVTSLSRAGQKRIAADVLVIGGGMAGTFAAVTARAKGLNVVVADKGTVGKSGCTPWARGFVVFDGAAGDDKSRWIENISRSGEYINNRDSLDALMADSLARYNDLVAWGALKEGIVNHGPVLREKLLASGVHLIERAMMTHLLLHDGRAAGAMGFSLNDEEIVVITAKAVVMSAGSGGFKPYGYPISSLTSDGHAMAYRAGAIITGKEFNDFHFTNVKNPASCWTNWSHEWRGGIGRTSYGRGGGGPGSAPDMACAFLADAGKAPVSMRSLRPSGGPGGGPGGPPRGGPRGGPGGGPPGGPGGGPRGGPGGGAGGPPGGGPPGGARADGPGAGGDVLGAGTGMSIHKAEGIWPADNHGGTNVSGLFAAGDGLGSIKEPCPMAIQSVDLQKCIGCGTCVATCPMDVFRLNKETEKSTITYPEDCQICHLCCVYCPKQAITVSPEKRTPVLVAWG